MARHAKRAGVSRSRQQRPKHPRGRWSVALQHAPASRRDHGDHEHRRFAGEARPEREREEPRSV